MSIDFAKELQLIRGQPTPAPTFRPVGPQVPQAPSLDIGQELQMIRTTQPVAPPTPSVPNRYLSTGPFSLGGISDILRTGEYAVGGLLAGKGIRRGIQERTESGPQFATLFQRLGAPDSFATDAAAFISSLVVDPINLVGIGLPGKALRAVGAAGAAAKADVLGVKLAAPVTRAMGAVAERVAPGLVRAAEGRKAIEPIIERQIIQESQGVGRVLDLGKAIRQDAAKVAPAVKDARRLDQALGLYFDAGADTLLYHIAQERQGATMAASIAQREATRRQALSIGQAARVSAGAVQQTAAASLSGLREAVTGSVGLLSDIIKDVGKETITSVSRVAAENAIRGGSPEHVGALVKSHLRDSLKGLSEDLQNSVVFRASETAAAATARGATPRAIEQEVARAVTTALEEGYRTSREAIVKQVGATAEYAAARGATPRQMEAIIARELRQSLEGLGVAKDTQGAIQQAFRRAASPITRGRTQEMASAAAQGVRATLKRTRQEAEAATQAIGRVPFDPAAIARGRQAGEQSQQAFLRNLDPGTRSFVEKWAPVVQQHDTDLAQNLVRVGMMRPETAAKWEGMHLRRIYQKFEDPQAFVEFLDKTDPAKAAELLGKIERGIPISRVGQPIPTAVTKQRQALEAGTRAQLGEIHQASSRLVAGGALAEQAVARGDAFQKIANQFAVDRLKVEQAGGFASQLFRQMPDTAGWGKLAGQWLPKEIAEPLLNMGKRPEGVEKVLTTLTGWFKFAKVILNPATHMRNVRTNVSLIHNQVGFRGLDPMLWAQAWKEVATNGKTFQEAKNVSSAFVDTFTNSEIRRFVNDADAVGFVRKNFDRFIGGPASRAYEFEEQIGKMVAYLAAKKNGMGPEAAAKLAETALFNYRKVPPVIAKMRSVGIYPFITFPYKVATETVPQIIRRPGRFSQQIKAIDAVSTEAPPAEQQALPPNMRQGAFVRLPWNDARGRSIYYDLTYESALGDIAETGTPAGQVAAMLRGEIPLKESILPLLTPTGQLVAEIAMNKSAFTGQELRRKGESKARGNIRQIARAVLPGGAFAVGETVLAKLGLEPEPTSALAKAVMGTPSRMGEAPQSVPQAALATFTGMRTVPVDVAVQRKQRTLELKNAVDAARSEIVSIARNPALKPEDKRARIQAVQAKLRQQLQGFRQEGFVKP